MSFSRRNFLSRSIKEFGSLCRDVVDEQRRKKEAEQPKTDLGDVFRPPGAINEKDFLDKCTRCDDCIQACPHDVLFKVFDRSSPSNLSPNFSPSIDPCLLCDGLPCIQACETGALIMPEEGKKPIMGLAQIYIDSCLNWQDQKCQTCLDECPENAIIFDSENRVRINNSLCTGCGVCENSCPIGNFAIEVVLVER